MLTKDLLDFRTRSGRIYPKLIADQAHERDVAESLLACLGPSVGRPRGEVEAELAAVAGAHRRPRIAKGLVKLLLDRCEFAHPDPEAAEARSAWLRQADDVRRGLPLAASFEEYEARLSEVIELAQVRDALYADLPGRRPLLGFKALDADKLLARYDLAQVQGLLLYAERLELQVEGGDTPELRRLLRWMRFCRLVTDVRVDDEGWSLVIEGPAAVLDSAKKYGLQLATFFLVVPTVERWAVRAAIKLPRRAALVLEISHEQGLRPGLEGGAGFVPPEIESVVARWSDPDWRLDANPAPRPVGVHEWCVPDLDAHRDGRTVAIELFHPWHQGAWRRRRAALAARPQPDLIMGIDRKLARRLEVDAGPPETFEFSGFPTERGLRKALAAWWSSTEPR